MSMQGWPSTGVCTGKVTFLSPAVNDTWSSWDTGGSSHAGIARQPAAREGRDYRIAAFRQAPVLSGYAGDAPSRAGNKTAALGRPFVRVAHAVACGRGITSGRSA